MGPTIASIAIILILILVSGFKIVPQTYEYVVERLGKYSRTLDAGIHVTVPLIEKVAKKVTKKEDVLDTPPQPVITKDNVSMKIDAVVYYKVFDSQLYTYGAVNPIQALANLTATTLRNVIGELSLDETLTSRDSINNQMESVLDKATDPWGIKVTRVEIKNIIPPADIQEAMQKEMTAERLRRETVLNAEGHKQAAITRAEGDKQALVLQAEGERDARIARAEGEARALLLKKQAEADALRLIKESKPDGAVLELKRYEAMEEIANGKAVKLIIPTDMVELTKKNVVFSETTGLGDSTKEAPDEPEQPLTDICCGEETAEEYKVEMPDDDNGEESK